jgi:hypothetical protein
MNRRKAIHNRQGSPVTSHDPEADLTFRVLQYLPKNNYSFGH